MKTDNFDDQIRKKLESIELQPSPADIDRVYRYAARPRFARFGRIFPLSVLALSTVILLAVILWQRDENKKLSSEVAVLKQRELKDESLKNNALTNQGTTENLPKDNLSNTYSGQPSAETVLKQSGTQNDNSIAERSLPNRVQRGNQTLSTTTGQNDRIAGSKGRNGFDKLTVNTSNSDKNLKVALSKDLGNKLSDNQQIASKNLKPVDSAVDKPLIAPIPEKSKRLTTDAGEKPLVKQTKSHNLKPTFSLGAAFDGSFSGAGGHLFGEVMISRFTLNIGIGRGPGAAERYENRQDFHEKTGKDFDRLYPVWKPTDSVENIQLADNIIQMPVQIGYRLPLSTNWALRFNAGTNFDLSRVHHLECDAEHYGGWPPPPADDMQHFSYDYKNSKVVFFNNLTLSAGVERTWKHIYLTANPYFITTVKNVYYRKPQTGGLTVSAGYRF
jgi:hypothetical protein